VSPGGPEDRNFVVVGGPCYDLDRVRDLTPSEHCGVILKKLTISGATAWILYDEADRYWWIVGLVEGDDRLRKIGFIDARREVCWETFEALDAAAITALPAID
jgi:hypothetical protein